MITEKFSVSDIEYSSDQAPSGKWLTFSLKLSNGGTSGKFGDLTLGLP